MTASLRGGEDEGEQAVSIMETTDAQTDRQKRGRDKQTPEKLDIETKKQKSEATRPKTQTQTQTQADVLRSRPKDKDKTKTDKDRQRDVSEPRENPWKWLRIYMRTSSKIPINCQNVYNKDRLRQAIRNGETKIQWRNPKYSYEQIHGALVNGNITLLEEMFKKVDDREYDKVKVGLITSTSPTL